MGSAALLPNAVKYHLVLQMNLNSNSESRGRSQMPKDPQISQSFDSMDSINNI
uniref:Uncharacterized protein n=1 Tax=Magallana gigas TaxID=29159 RepID=K1QYX1_MAGGI